MRKGTAAAHYVLGGPQGNDTNAFSLGSAATEINVMNGETAATAMYSRRLAKDKKAGKDLQPTIDKMNDLIQDYAEKSKPFSCAKSVSYTHLDVYKRQELMAMGYTGVPVICVDDEQIVGFDKARLDELLK